MIILPLTSSEASLENSGGKGASLTRLSRLGLPVPSGFIITTHAYRLFVTENSLADVITPSLVGATAGEAGLLEKASQQIRSAFSTGRLSPDIREAVKREYRLLDPDSRGVAVRSSATMEDLPDMSFAGQQDTYLNIVGENQLLKAIIDCWSSLWTARAIGYRLRNAIPHQDTALAVVVQQMVFSDVSGVLFTANPLTGLLSEAVIDAAFGLGEALVSGQVEPDHFVIDTTSGEIRSITLGAKEISIHGKAGGGVAHVCETAAQKQALTEDQVDQLVEVGQRIQDEYGSPQDIEWAFKGSELFILQSRPITTLFPVPRVSFTPLFIWISFGAVQGMIAPITPLGREAIQRVVVGMGTKLQIKVTYENQDLFAVAGERIWIKMSDVIRHPLGKRLFSGFLGFVEPSIRQIIQTLMAEPQLEAGQGRIKLRTLVILLRFFLPVVVHAIWTILRPEAARKAFNKGLEDYLQTMCIPPGRDAYEQLGNLAAFLGSQGGLADALPTLLPRFIPIFGPAMASLNLIGRLLPHDDHREHGFSMAVMEVTRGLPNNVTTEMDLALWKTATILREDQTASDVFKTLPSSTLAARYLDGTLPPAAQQAVARFLARYGMRCTGEIDIGRPRWREDPQPVMETLISYMHISPEAAPDMLFERGARAAEVAIERLAAEVRNQPGGWIKEKLVRAAAIRVRLLLGARESPKFCAVRAMGIVRQSLLEAGAELEDGGIIDHHNDLCFLQVSELQALSRREEADWKALINRRKRDYERELRRKQVPRLLVSDGRAYYEGIGAEIDDDLLINGSPVSPGVVEGKVRVVLDPHGAKLAPGEILVCPGTDPAWTPLFMVAGGLVMEVGGMMTHGSVVAREYGIPAVVGVHQATLRLKDGQRIQLDGTSGRIVIL